MSSNAKVKKGRRRRKWAKGKLGEKEMQQDSCNECTNNYGFRV
jgi:hypothetical protein